MQSLLTPGQAVATAPGDNVDAVVDIDLQQLFEAKGLRTAADEGDVVDGEHVFHRRRSIQLFKHRFRVESRFDFNDELEPVLPVGEVGDSAYPGDFLVVDAVLDFLDDLFRADEIGQLGDHQAGLSGRDGFHAHFGASSHRTASAGVGIAHAVKPDDDAAGGEVGSGNELHELFQARVRVGNQVPSGRNHLTKVVRSHIGCHSNGDTARAVDQEVRVGGREHLWLRELIVVVRNERNDVLIQISDHGQRWGRKPCLGVARCGGAVIERAEVAVSVNKRHAQRKILRHSHECVVNG